MCEYVLRVMYDYNTLPEMSEHAYEYYTSTHVADEIKIIIIAKQRR